MESASLPVGKLSTPELRTLVQDLTRTVSYVLRPFGVQFQPASEEEADAIAIPGARMLGKHIKLSNTIRRVSDPVVLVGATVALFSVRRITATRDAAARSPAPSPVPSVRSDPRVTQTAEMPTAPMQTPPLRRATDAFEAGLRDSIMDSIAGAGVVT